jgi:hypothetical protein
MHHRDDLRLRKQDAVGVAQDNALVNELLTAENHMLCREAGLLGDPQRTPCVRPAHGISALNMDQSHVRTNRVDVHEAVGDREVRVGVDNAAPQKSARRKARDVPGRGPKRE